MRSTPRTSEEGGKRTRHYPTLPGTARHAARTTFGVGSETAGDVAVDRGQALVDGPNVLSAIVRPQKRLADCRHSIERFNFALQLDQQRLPLAIPCFARGYFDPAFADAVFIDIETLLTIQPNADVTLEHGGDVMRAARVD